MFRNTLLTTTISMIDLKPIIHTILKGYALPWNGVHGVAHWARVLENGVRLATDAGAVLEVVRLFAVFHDSRRVDDYGDYGHGRRGAELATELRGTLFDLPDADFELLYEACADHTNGLTEGDITVQCCWDADRLDLGRFGTTPDPHRLCTATAKSLTMREWAHERACREVVPGFVKDDWGFEL